MWKRLSLQTEGNGKKNKLAEKQNKCSLPIFTYAEKTWHANLLNIMYLTGVTSFMQLYGGPEGQSTARFTKHNTENTKFDKAQ